MSQADYIPVRGNRPPVVPTLRNRTMICDRCHERTERRSPRQTYCPECSKIRERETVAANNAKRQYAPVTPRQKPAVPVFRDPRFAELDRAMEGHVEQRYRLPGKRIVYRWLRECGYKRCWSCETVKDLSHFHRLASSPDGRSAQCTACNHTLSTEWRHKYPEKWRVIRQRETERRRARRNAAREPGIERGGPVCR